MKQPHILCEVQDVSPAVILPGDPARVCRIAGYLTEPREIAVNREFTTVCGTYEGIPMTVTSTGIGGASMAIAVEELIRCGARYLIRTGSCGACQPGIGIGDIVLSSGAVREDGAGRMYVPDCYPAVADPQLLQAAVSAAGRLGYPLHTGITRSHDSFYIDDEQERMDYWNLKGVLASDMETAALYVLAALRGVQALSILNTVVTYRGSLEEGINAYTDTDAMAEEGERREILLALAVAVAAAGSS